MGKKYGNNPPIAVPRKPESRSPSNLTVKKQRFLEAFVFTGTVLGAARKAGVSATMHYEWMTTNPIYRKEFRKAVRRARQLGMTVARRLAIQGVKRKKFYKGKPIRDPETKKQYFEVEHDTKLLIRLLEVDFPEKFTKRQQIDHKHERGIQVTLSRAAIEQHAARHLGRNQTVEMPPAQVPAGADNNGNGNGHVH